MDFIIVAIVFGTVFGFLGKVVNNAKEVRLKKLELEAQRVRGLPPGQAALGPGQDAEALKAAFATERRALEERIEHLETIVCSVDFELNAKLNRLASTQMQALPAAGDSGATGQEPARARFEPGERVADRFVIEQRLGQGGMGSVFRAKDERLGEVVALKIIAGAGLLDPAARERFRREATSARRISHPNVVRIHDVGEEKGALFLSMEYVSGSSLADLLARHGQLPVKQVRDVAAQVLAGLGAAHEQGVVHRDLKPHNVLFDGEQRAKIIDFGLARLPHLEGMTATGALMGTPEYMAPEQIETGRVEPRTDLYAWAATLYHLVTGQPPFRGATPIAVTLAHVTQEPRDPREIRSDLDEAWSAFLLKGLSKDPEARFVDAAEMRSALP